MTSLSIKALVASRNRFQLNREKVAQEAKRLMLLTAGVAMVSFGFITFQVPHNLNAGGVTGTAIVANHYFDTLSIGATYWLLNLPLLILGFFHLGRWQFLGKTLLASTMFAVLTDTFAVLLPRLYDTYPLSDDLLLNAIFTAIVGGFGGGLIFRSGGTMGGTGVIGRIIQRRTGQPLSQVYFYTDGLIISLSALVFGWEMSLYGFLMLFLYGIASDYAMEGPSRTRTATIVTDKKDALSVAIQNQLGRGVSYWEIRGGYENKPHHMLSTTLLRSQVEDLKQLVAQVDENAFVTIGLSHDALGAGFSRIKGRI